MQCYNTSGKGVARFHLSGHFCGVRLMHQEISSIKYMIFSPMVLGRGSAPETDAGVRQEFPFNRTPTMLALRGIQLEYGKILCLAKKTVPNLASCTSGMNGLYRLLTSRLTNRSTQTERKILMSSKRCFQQTFPSISEFVYLAQLHSDVLRFQESHY